MALQESKGQKKVSFDALIYEVKNRCCKDGSKVTRLVLEFTSSDLTEELNRLNELQNATKYVAVGIVERPPDGPGK